MPTGASRARIRARETVGRDAGGMTEHRPPGMSISTEEWQALTELAQARGLTRTELIRASIVSTITTSADAELLRLQQELSAARRQLKAIRTALSHEDAMIAA